MNVEESATQRAQRLAEIFSRLVGDLITDHSLREETGGEISRTQFAGLRFIRCHAGCALQDLAGGLDVSHPAALKLFERLSKKGLVRRQTAADDRRRAELRVSRRGERLLQAICDRQTDRVQQIVDAMPAEDAAGMERSLRAFIVAALDNPEVVDRACLQCGRDHDPECLLQEARLRFAAEQKPKRRAKRSRKQGPAAGRPRV